MSEQDQPKDEPAAIDRKEKGRLLVMGPSMADTLSTSQREQAEKLVKGMLYSLHESEKYLSDYLASRVNAAKVCGVISQMADRMQEEVVKILRMHENKE
ncbi:MAG TPA: hypothetical protein VMG82_22490 [Candidatus Sulfotelmatobacter sp.]|nr:hypothetical protein [Candidatus Sulfotelmatobacter sp.]